MDRWRYEVDYRIVGSELCRLYRSRSDKCHCVGRVGTSEDDHTRNGSKRWCSMTKGGPDGRACGTIAKVAAYRAREATKANAT
ncbi:CGNR zinc finger domain-containing protein [Paraburkholderia sp. 40]